MVFDIIIIGGIKDWGSTLKKMQLPVTKMKVNCFFFILNDFMYYIVTILMSDELT